MTKRFAGTQLLIASKNEGKVVEIKELLSDFNVEVLSAVDVDAEEPEETGETFIENAELKARYYGEKTGLPALADDSGLAVEALGGMPGIYSARWAGPNKDFKSAMKRIKTELGKTDNKKAKFVCALSLYNPKTKEIYSFEGVVEGNLTFPPKGSKGFGYDPIFIPNGYNKTFAEISHEDKQRVSHRARAFEKFIKECFK